MTQTGAARAAGYKSPNVRAVQLLKNPVVRERMEEMRNELESKYGVTITKSVRDMQRLRDEAWEAGNFGAAIKATPRIMASKLSAPPLIDIGKSTKCNIAWGSGLKPSAARPAPWPTLSSTLRLQDSNAVATSNSRGPLSTKSAAATFRTSDKHRESEVNVYGLDETPSRACQDSAKRSNLPEAYRGLDLESHVGVEESLTLRKMSNATAPIYSKMSIADSSPA